MAIPKPEHYTAQEKEYHATVASCIPKVEHVVSPDKEHQLYTITTLASSDWYGGNRTPAICDNLTRAKEIVERNEGDIWEYTYMLVVIESVKPNCVYSIGSRDEFWYRWNLELNRYEPIEKPEAYKNTVSFGIG